MIVPSPPPRYDRIVSLIFVILIGLAVVFLVDGNPNTLRIVLGGDLPVITLSWFLIASLVVITCAGADLLARAHPALLTQTLPTGHTSTFAYDEAGNLAGSVDAQGLGTAYEYDAHNRLVAATLDPDGRAVRAEYVYDLADNLLARAWKLRENVTAYDAMYLALAEALDATVVTCDVPLARAAGSRTRVEAVE